MPEKVGRPTVMTDNVMAKLEEGFTMGFSDSEACLYANISKDSLYRYCKDNEEFSDRKETLKNHPKLLAKGNIYRSLKDGKRLDDSRWYLERKLKKEFGNSIDHTTDGEKIVAGFSYISNGKDNTNNKANDQTGDSMEASDGQED